MGGARGPREPIEGGVGDVSGCCHFATTKPKEGERIGRLIVALAGSELAKPKRDHNVDKRFVMQCSRSGWKRRTASLAGVSVNFHISTMRNTWFLEYTLMSMIGIDSPLALSPCSSGSEETCCTNDLSIGKRSNSKEETSQYIWYQDYEQYGIT